MYHELFPRDSRRGLELLTAVRARTSQCSRFRIDVAIPIIGGVSPEKTGSEPKRLAGDRAWKHQAGGT